MYNTTGNLNVNYGLWIIIMCLHVDSSIITDVPLWWEMFIMWGMSGDWGYMVNFSTFPSICP